MEGNGSLTLSFQGNSFFADDEDNSRRKWRVFFERTT